MSADLFKRAGLFVAFILAQTLVLGSIHLFGYATPMLYVYFVLLFPRNYPKWGILLWSFCMGLVIDMFFNTHWSRCCLDDTDRCYPALLF